MSNQSQEKKKRTVITDEELGQSLGRTAIPNVPWNPMNAELCGFQFSRQRFIILGNLDISSLIVWSAFFSLIFLTFYGSLLFKIISKRQVLYFPFFPLDFSPQVFAHLNSRKAGSKISKKHVH